MSKEEKAREGPRPRPGQVRHGRRVEFEPHLIGNLGLKDLLATLDE